MLHTKKNENSVQLRTMTQISYKASIFKQRESALDAKSKNPRSQENEEN